MSNTETTTIDPVVIVGFDIDRFLADLDDLPGALSAVLAGAPRDEIEALAAGRLDEALLARLYEALPALRLTVDGVETEHRIPLDELRASVTAGLASQAQAGGAQ